jgi:rubrerythrin
MPTEQQQTSVSNTYYDLVSVLYHALEASQTYASYIRDAQASGNQQLVQFFQQVQQEDNNRAQRAQQLLTQLSQRS